MSALGRIAFVVFATALITCKGEGKKFGKCELAWELLRLQAPRDDLTKWMCIVQHESSYNTAVIGKSNSDGSYDYGLFQINSRFWCYGPYPNSANGCKMSCESLIDDNISNDFQCALLIKSDSGFEAWTTWTFCKDQSLDAYITGCGI